MNYSNTADLSIYVIAHEWAKEPGAWSEDEIKSELLKSFFKGDFVHNGKGLIFLPDKKDGKVPLRIHDLFILLYGASALTFEHPINNKYIRTLPHNKLTKMIINTNITKINTHLNGDDKLITDFYVNQAFMSRDALKRYCEEKNITPPVSIYPPRTKQPKLKKSRVGRPKHKGYALAEPKVFEALDHIYQPGGYCKMPYLALIKKVETYFTMKDIKVELPGRDKFNNWLDAWKIQQSKL